MSAHPAREPRFSAAGSPARSRRPLVMFALIALPVLILDQVSKYLISTHLQPYTSRIAIIPGWFDLTYTLNPGAAFSLFATMPEWFRFSFFITLSVAAIIVLSVLLARNKTGAAISLGMAAILGGTIGNLIDRVAYGRVIDFLYFHHAWFSYPVFNLADSAITVGVALILLTMLFEGDNTHQAT